MVGEQFADLLQSGSLQVFYCPEFLREGTAVADFREPSLAVVGMSNSTAWCAANR